MNLFTTPAIKFLLLAFIYITCCPLYSQEVKITYNYITKNVSYEKNGVLLKDTVQPKLKKGDHITVEVEDVNPYLFYVVVDYKDSVVAPVTAVLGSFASNINSTGLPKLFPGASTLLSAIPEPSSKGVPETFGLKGSKLRNALRRDRLNKILAGQRYKILLALDSQLVSIKKEVIKIVNFNDTLCSYSHVIDGTIHNPSLSEKAIKDSVYKLEIKVLGDTTGNALKQIAKNNDDTLKEAYYTYLAYLSIYASTTAQVAYDFSKLDSDLVADIDSSMESIDFEITRKRNIYNVQGSLDSVTADASTILALINRNSYASISATIDAIILKRTELTATKFNYSKSNITARKDFKNININIYYKDSTGSHTLTITEIKNLPVAEVKSFSFMAGHPLYSFPSIGVAFSRMFKQQYTYQSISQNGKQVIASTRGDIITPSVDAQFTLATPTNKRFVDYGGTVGVGLSLADESLDFILGPSLLLGGNQKLIITAGVIVGQVTKLSGGYEVGSSLNSGQSVPVTKAYSVGYFLGLSYIPKF